MTTYLISDHEFANPRASAQFLPTEQFLEIASSDAGLSCESVYIDANVVDEDLYQTLKATGFAITYVRDKGHCPSFIEEPVEDWSPEKPSAKERLAQANGLLHRFVLDKQPRFFIAILIAAIVLCVVMSANYRSLPNFIFILCEFACMALLAYGAMGLVLRTLYTGAAKIGGRCEKCQQWGAIKKGRKEVLGTEAISIKKTLENKNTRGDVISTSEQYIPGTRTFYRQWYLCSKCGHESYKDSCRDVASV